MNPQMGRSTDLSFDYFIPELYLRISSSDKMIADQASAEWEDANQHYYQYLETILPKMTAEARNLAEFSCLHDTTLIDFREITAHETTVELVVRNEEQLLTRLTYICWAPVRQSLPRTDLPTDCNGINWVLDEFQMVVELPSRFVHRILFSDGRRVEIPFSDVGMHTFRSGPVR